jgi:hypothetical protein
MGEAIMNLDLFIASAVERVKHAKRAKRKVVKDDSVTAYHKTREELRAMKLAACVPVSVHLRITQQTCECGEVYNAVNSWPLIKRVSPILTHFEAVKSQDPNALTEYNHLPRIIETRELSIPWCETCFANATYVEGTHDAL